jgi:hypothetical protein
MRRRKTAAAAGQIVDQLVPHVYADAGETATGGGVDCSDVDGAQLSDDARIARSADRQRMLGVQRLETSANETREPKRDEGSAKTSAAHCEKDPTHRPDALALRRAKHGGPCSAE